MTQEVTDATFQTEVIESDKPVLVDFWAEWCGPCRVVGPIIDELSEEHDNVKVLKLDIDENQETASKYGIHSIPTVLIFKTGEIVKKIIGAHPRASYDTALAEI